jgi:asparagine synthase (glutamine-hydrolysing)
MHFTFNIAQTMDITRKIRLVRYKWQQAGCTLATGSIRDEDTFVSSGQLAARVDFQSIDFDVFKARVGNLNGQFSLVVEKENEVWVTCSPTWSYPLFYHLSSFELCISDDPGVILSNLPEKKISIENRFFFLNFGVTPHAETLVSGIQQVRPGEVIRFSQLTNGKEHILNSFHREKVFAKSEKETYELLFKVFETYAGFLKDKKVLVPLTGGYDSRLIACLLKEMRHPHVTCATWGRSGNSEGITAERVARTLEFPYLFVPVDNKLLSGFWNDEQFKRYIDWSGHFSSMPYLQDYFAIKFLKETGVIDEGTVVLPGHPGDFLRGSHLVRGLPGQNSGEVIGNIIHNFGTSLPLNKAERNSIRETITASFFSNEKPFHPVEEYERWDYEERQCKFIGNSSQVYTFFGINHMMPLFDKELLDYFLALPFEQRLGADLYNKTLEKLIFRPNGCDFDLKPAGNEMKQGNRWKYFVLKWIPHFIREWYYPMKDDAFYREITRELMDSDPSTRYRKPIKSHYYNSYLTQWYWNRVSAQLN